MENSKPIQNEHKEQPRTERSWTLPEPILKIKKRMIDSRIPWILVGVFVGLLLAKALVIYALAWMLDAGLIPYIYSNPYSATDISQTSDLFLALANRWDSIHFIEIARNGYPLGVSNDILFAFAPIYPMMIAGLNYVVGNLYVSGAIVSNVFYFLAVISFYKVARFYMDYDYACLATLGFGLFPTFLAYGTVAYSEAPYLAFAISSWYFFKKEQYLACSILTTLAILIRYISALLIFIYGIIILWNMIKKREEGLPLAEVFDLRLLWFSIPLVCVVAFFTYLWSLTGSFFVAFDAHAFFHDRLSTPLHQFRFFFEGFFTEINPGVEPMILAVLRYMFTLPFLALAIYLVKDDTELGLYGLVFMWFTLSMEGISGIASPRIMLSAWVALLAFRNRIDKGLYLVLCVMYLVAGIWVIYQFQRTFFA
ncbi:hypothetical protein EU545_04475 [Candidatus Thorarchaeota archaeon]|nr:MAG: hypothetical protein EU545_04475 [Candidatus Thorarchaeota archaeon]